MAPSDSAAGRAADPGDPRKLPVIADLDLSNATLTEAFDRIRDASNVNLVVRWNALEAAGVDRARPVRMRLWDTRVGEALDVVLLKTLGPDPRVVWQLRGNVIVVSTPEDLSDSHTRTFDVRDLIRLLREAAQEREEALTWREAEDEIIELVSEMVDPDSWRDAGGNVGAIRMVRRGLVVTQSAAGMRKVEAFLDALRRELAAPPPATRPAVPPGPPEEQRRDASAAVVLKTSARIEKLDLPDTTLEQAIERVGVVAGVPVVVNWLAIENAGVSKRATVSVHLRNVNVGQALVEVLSGAGGGVVSFRAWEADDAVNVSTADDVKPERARFYDIRDLIVSLERAHKDGFRGPGGREGNRREVGDEILRLITENVEPASWRDAGGSVGDIRYRWGRLIVTQTAEGHRAIEKYLDTLRHEFIKDDRPGDSPTAPSAPSKLAPRPAGG